MGGEITNPFSLTRSTDMTDDQIDKLWVELSNENIQKIVSADAVIVKSGKGSGKTHLFRHHSFPLQKIRYDRDGVDVFDGIKKDKYIGIYLRCGGLNASRFQGQGINEDKWLKLFVYALELLLAQELIHITKSLFNQHPKYDRLVSEKIFHLFDEANAAEFNSLSEVEKYIDSLRRRLDLAINNYAFDREVSLSDDAKIRVNRGKLIFGIPEMLSQSVPELKDITFIYLIDELENFTSDQQRYVNTLIREKVPSVSIKIGVRKYGIKTYATFSSGEELIEGSEFETLPLDENLKQDFNRYKEFLCKLLNNRLKQVTQGLNQDNVVKWAESLFEDMDFKWNNEQIRQLVLKDKKEERPYFKNLIKKLSVSFSNEEVGKVVAYLKAPDYPLIEKVNILRFYQELSWERNVVEIAKEINSDCADFLTNGNKDTKTGSKWSHFQQNIVFQLLKEYNAPTYSGIDDLVTMSEGMPRNFIYILKQICDWSLFKGENLTDSDSKFSIESQYKGIKKASDWFFKDMRKAGNDGQLVQTAIGKLAEIFRVNHYADKPVECSLIMFSANIQDASPEARRILEIAVDRSLLVKLDKGIKDKNLGYEKAKYQLNKMLCPRWGLPVAARGNTEFSPEEINIIFDGEVSGAVAFEKLLKKWEEKTSVSFSKPLERRPKGKQEDLFK